MPYPSMYKRRHWGWVGLAIVVFFWTTTLGQAQTSTPSPGNTTGAMVRLDKQLLFPIQTRVGPISAVERAQVITKRLEKLAQDGAVAMDSLEVKTAPELTEIVANDMVLVTLTEGDAQAAGKSRSQLAKDYLQTIKGAVRRYRAIYGEQSFWLRGGYAAGTTLVLVVILTLLNRLLPKFYAQLERWRGTRIQAIKIQELELLSEEQIVHVLVGGTKIIRQPLVLALLYVYLLLMLSFFPQTQGVAANLLTYLMAILNLFWRGFLAYLPNLAVLVVIGIITYYITKLVKLIMTAAERGIIGFPGFYQEWANPTYQIVRFLIVMFAIAVAVPYLPGSGSPALQGISIFLGIFVSLGATTVIANVFAGVALTYTRAFRTGDRVKIADTTGDVLEKTFLVTRVRTPKNVVVTIPNSMVLANHIVNFSASQEETGLILHTTITFGYDVPWSEVHGVLIGAAQATSHILADPAPFVLQTSLDDFYVSYELNAYTDRPALMQRTYSELHQNIQDRCNEAQLEILSPHFSAVRDGNPLNIPRDYLPKNYTAPGFRVHPLGQILTPGQSNIHLGANAKPDPSQGEKID